MKYVLLRVLERNVYHEYYCSNDLEFLREMKKILNNKHGDYFFIVEVLK